MVYLFTYTAFFIATIVIEILFKAHKATTTTKKEEEEEEEEENLRENWFLELI